MSDLREHLELRKRAFGPNIQNDFLLEYGRPYLVGPETYTLPRDEAQQCFKNATMMAITNDHLYYVEGYVSVHGIPIEHAWNVDKFNTVIDTTLRQNEDGRVGEYYGVMFKREYVRRAVLRNGVFGVLDYFYAGETAPKLYELGLIDGQQWLLDLPKSKLKRRRKAA